MKKNLIFIFITLLMCSCNKGIWEQCKTENEPKKEQCYKDCLTVVPDYTANQTKEQAIEECRKICKTKFREDNLNCYHSESKKCIRKCAKRRAKECRQNRRNCKKNARTRKKNCINQCKQDFRGRQRRNCKRNCRSTFRAEKRRCKSINCRKSQFNNACTEECN